jgi:N-acetylneuraminic acid mutarotase
VFGGKSLSRGALNDVQRFNIRTNRWEEVTVQIRPGDPPLPRGRYFHAAAYANSRKSIFIYGGLGHGQVFFDDFWAFSTIDNTWHKLKVRVNSS